MCRQLSIRSSVEEVLITLDYITLDYITLHYHYFVFFYKVNRILSRKNPEKPSIILHNTQLASSTSITKFIEFGKGHQKSRLTEKASKLKIDYLAFLKNGSTRTNKAWIILLVRR